jgi:hypothetical protein
VEAGTRHPCFSYPVSWRRGAVHRRPLGRHSTTRLPPGGHPGGPHSHAPPRPAGPRADAVSTGAPDVSVHHPCHAPVAPLHLPSPAEHASIRRFPVVRMVLERACQCGAAQHLTKCDDPRRCDKRPSCAHDPLAGRRPQRPNCMGPTKAKAAPSKSVRICSNSTGSATPCTTSAGISGTRMRDSTSAREDEGVRRRVRLHLRLQCIQNPTAPLRPVLVAPARPKWSPGDLMGWPCRALPRPGREGCRRAP